MGLIVALIGILPSTRAWVCDIILGVHSNYFAKPTIKCQKSGNQVEFSLNGDFKSVNLIVHPQLLVQYGNYIVLPVYLKNYYDKEEFVLDNEKTKSEKINYDEYVEGLKIVLEDMIVEYISRKNPDWDSGQLRDDLEISLSVMGGVRYQNMWGDEENRQCIIEEDGEVFLVGKNDGEIVSRLYNETEIKVRGNVIGIKRSLKIERIVQVVSEEIMEIELKERGG